MRIASARIISRPGRWRIRIGVGLITVFCAMNHSQGQGTLRFTFDGVPTAYPPGGGMFIQEYHEAGIWFRPIAPSGRIVRIWPSDNPFDAYNGTIFIRAGREDESLMFSFTNGEHFNLVAVDLAEFNWASSSTPVFFVGYRFDGSTVTTNFTPDGIINGTQGDFETFYFGDEFSSLVRVEIPTPGWSLDNVIVELIPEPSVTVLLITGGFLLLAVWFRQRTKINRL